MDLSTLALTSLIILYGILQYRRRERWFRDAMLLVTREKRPVAFRPTLNTFRVIAVAGALVGLFMLSGLVFMMEELTRGVAPGLMALAGLLALLLVSLALLILIREVGGLGKRPAGPPERKTGSPA